MTPLALAFPKKEYSICHDGWTCTELGTDIIFICEIFVAFNTAIYLSETQIYETRRMKIAKKYLKGWFIFDLVAVCPLFIQVTLPDVTEKGADLLGIVKFARISRIIKLLRLAKIFK